jgi:predicted transcriptional regulator
MVRVDDSTHNALVELAQEANDTLGALIAKAVAAYRAQRFWQAFDAAAAALRADPAAWGEAQAERAVWDTTLSDGLADDPYPVDRP